MEYDVLYLASDAVLWIGIVLMQIRIRISLLTQIQIQIWIGFKAMPIHMRILQQVLDVWKSEIPDPDLLVRGTDPDPSIIKQK